KEGKGSGTVSGTGISCGSDCTETYTSSGTSVSLTATPATNSDFISWSGCSSVNGNQCTVIIPNSNKVVTATFDLEPGAELKCGNGIIESGNNEECDDEGTSNGDGCSSTCKIEEEWTCNGEPSVCVETNQCLSIDFCESYTDPTMCNADSCSVGDGSSVLGDGCSWNATTSKCHPSFGATDINGSSGSCQITQDTSDDCSDGFFSFSWTGIWSGSPVSGPEDEQCVAGGSDTIPCPAKIQLPFFSTYNVIAVIVLAVLIYFIISLKKGSRVKKSSGSRKR
ncbi:MAG: hypothetical protein WD876_01590, partial [Candidatus Pacearchaeota archaeon]